MTRGKIIQVRGASGSGKTYLARQLIEPLGPPLRVRPSDDPKRKKPSLLVWPDHNLAVIGHYDVLCGGCDTIKSRSRPYDLARRAADDGLNVFMEGLFVSLELHRSVELHKDGYDRYDIFLQPEMSECISNVNARRAEQGKEPKELKQMAGTYPRMMRTYERMVLAHLPNLQVFRGKCQEITPAALTRVKEILE